MSIESTPTTPTEERKQSFADQIFENESPRQVFYDLCDKVVALCDTKNATSHRIHVSLDSNSVEHVLRGVGFSDLMVGADDLQLLVAESTAKTKLTPVAFVSLACTKEQIAPKQPGWRSANPYERTIEIWLWYADSHQAAAQVLSLREHPVQGLRITHQSLLRVKDSSNNLTARDIPEKLTYDDPRIRAFIATTAALFEKRYS